MSVELLDTPRFHGYRVRRQINGRTYQEYFSLKEDGRRLRGARRADVKRAAEERDAQLSAKQAKAREQASRQVHVRDGRVRGILFRLKTEKSGTRTPVFQIGIMSNREERIVNTTVSVSLHGLEAAWSKAVSFYAWHKKISRRSRAFSELIEAQPSEDALRKLLRDGR